ncbi:ribonucleoside-diphosphate reductase subunit alpha [bacterium]|nr:ribonucleoside-diphosphate reductase subunit alpha [bacterium]
MSVDSVISYIIKRNGEKVEFDQERISIAIHKAFLSENICTPEVASELAREVVLRVRENIGNAETTQVEFVQDLVEEVLMLRGHHKVAKRYILYRERHKEERQQQIQARIREKTLEVVINGTETVIFNPITIEENLRQLAPDLMRVSITEMVDAVTRQVYDRIPIREIELLVLGAARERIERHYEYAYLAARIAINDLYKKVLGEPMNTIKLDTAYRKRFAEYIQHGIALELLNPELGNFDLNKISAALSPQRDKLFMYHGVQILLDRYLLQDRSYEKNTFELPQWFWMRVAMGLAIKETHKEDRAIEFYSILSSLDLVSSTPTLFNSGTLHSQMSSCYLNTVDDSLGAIFKTYSDNAFLSKWAGGIGTDWTRVRGTGSKIKGTNGSSQGVIPFIKIFNDVALAVNQGGKRKGAMCAYLEVWHSDFEQFLELKKNTGDERRRAHDINTAAWIPDLFMKRVIENADWTFFCPGDAIDLHDLYGKAFEDRYEYYEKSGTIPRTKTVKALDLWKKMLTMLYETGHPWITFKDAANVRNPQSHCGVIHSSNLCTEITLNTSDDETAVCNLASINLANMIKDGRLDEEKIKKTVSIGIRMLDNVIDNNFYPTQEAKKANFRHRAVGLGLMGYQDALYQLDISFDSDANLEFADRSMEMISYYAIEASSDLAAERGSYETYPGSKWAQGIFPFDTIQLLEKERGREIEVSKIYRMDWDQLKSKVSRDGIRNSNTMAIAPTATIANISGVYPCTEPAYKNIYMKENLSGNFVVINRYLIDDLEKIGLWDNEMLSKIKLNNGSVSEIGDVPNKLKSKYKETFEIDSQWIVDAASRRSKWIDQSASTNIFMATTSGKALSDIYLSAWKKGLKTTYYLRTLGASQVTKATVAIENNRQMPRTTSSDASDVIVGDANTQVQRPSSAHTTTQAALLPTVMDSECEACQ